MAIERLITRHLDIWSSARKTRAGRAGAGKIDLYGIKKLRELILDLAVRGKLVPQNPNDEPASVLLKRIAQEKAELIKQRKIKPQKPLPPISEEEKPFKLPDGWEWVRISEIGHDWGQKTPNKDFTYIDVGSINKEHGIIEEPSILSAKDAPSRARKIVQKKTVIYSTVRPYLLNIAIIENDISPEPIASTAFAIVHPYTDMSANFIYYYLRSPVFISYVENCQIGVVYPAINDKQFFSGIIAIPPSSEQIRITKKIKVLMSLCDQLEQHALTSLEAHQQLIETLLATLTNSQNADQLAENWTRINQHFDILFTTEASIDRLKQTILQLAVTGKLVPQNPTDEPASVLLKRNEEQKQKLSRNKNMKTTASHHIRGDEYYIDAPKNWSWVRLGNLAKFIDYRGKTPQKKENGIRLITAKNIRKGYIDLNPEEFISEEDYTLWMTRGFPNCGDMLFTTEAPLGNAAIIDLNEKFALAQRSICFQWHIKEISPFMLIQIMAMPFQLQLNDKSTGMTATGIKASKLKEIPVILPPHQEQVRIVSKVQKLMSLCDQLKTSFQSTQQTQLHLADTLTGIIKAKS